jgi:energy-coupling factor transport system substrate-specific component
MINLIKNRRVLTILSIVVAALTVIAGFMIFRDRQYALISVVVAVLACVPFFGSFERHNKSNSRKLVLLAVMVAISVAGRFMFAFIPFFKPVTAIIIIYAIVFGPETGFLCGALSALISNFYFGQGPWTPFQMLVWGLIGLMAGLLANPLEKNRVFLVLFGIFAGLFFSVIMDVWVVLWLDGTFLLSRYVVALATGFPATAVYAFSNVVFLLIGIRPIGGKLKRMRIKYGL